MGRGTKAIYRRLLALPLAVALVLGASSPVLAVDPASPTTFTIDSVQAVTNVSVTDDVLIAFKYTIAYDTDQPTTPANKLFHFRLMDDDGVTQLGAVEPYAYNNSGYDMGYSAFYFDPLSAPDWESSLVLIMAGNPQYWETPTEISYTLVTTDYSQLETKTENQQLLGDWIITVCQELEVDWSVKLLTETVQGTILNDTGAAYGKGTIPGLQTLAPQIFSVKTQVINTDRRGWTTAMSDSWGAQWEGTMVGDALDGLQELFSLDNWIILTSLITLIICIGFFVWGFAWISDNQAAMVANSHVLAGSTALGLLHPAALAVIVLIYGLATGYMVIGDKS